MLEDSLYMLHGLWAGHLRSAASAGAEVGKEAGRRGGAEGGRLGERRGRVSWPCVADSHIMPAPIMEVMAAEGGGARPTDTRETRQLTTL